MIYKSVNAPIEFKKVKQERFTQVINRLKDIRNAQEAYKTVNNKFAKDFATLIEFVENGQYTLIQKRTNNVQVQRWRLSWPDAHTKQRQSSKSKFIRW